MQPLKDVAPELRRSSRQTNPHTSNVIVHWKNFLCINTFVSLSSLYKDQTGSFVDLMLFFFSEYPAAHVWLEIGILVARTYIQWDM